MAASVARSSPTRLPHARQGELGSMIYTLRAVCALEGMAGLPVQALCGISGWKEQATAPARSAGSFLRHEHHAGWTWEGGGLCTECRGSLLGSRQTPSSLHWPVSRGKVLSLPICGTGRWNQYFIIGQAANFKYGNVLARPTFWVSGSGRHLHDVLDLITISDTSGKTGRFTVCTLPASAFDKKKGPMIKSRHPSVPHTHPVDVTLSESQCSGRSAAPRGHSADFHPRGPCLPNGAPGRAIAAIPLE